MYVESAGVPLHRRFSFGKPPSAQSTGYFSKGRVAVAKGITSVSREARGAPDRVEHGGWYRADEAQWSIAVGNMHVAQSGTTGLLVGLNSKIPHPQLPGGFYFDLGLAQVTHPVEV